MDLNQKLQDLKNELKQRESEKKAAHNRIILLRRKIKEFERVMKEAEPFFEEEISVNGIKIINDASMPKNEMKDVNSAIGFTEGSNHE
jgi:hypothetical protein